MCGCVGVWVCLCVAHKYIVANIVEFDWCEAPFHDENSF